ncbi:MAG TPA: DNA-directed RNA polymerase subunit N [Thermoproteota archaeon]|nr:DNA-directed RNA polymerase subunit N [Thermoproteota archaeon]
MIVPVRCFTCGKVIGDKYKEFLVRTKEKGEDPEAVLDSLGLKRVCCRRMVVSAYEYIDEVLAYSEGVKR